MIKRILLIMLLSSILHAEEERSNIYERSCVPCHRYLPSSLEGMFMAYLKTFSGEYTFKASLRAFLKEPKEETSVMSTLFVERFSVKDKTTLSDKELEDAINIYWDMYDVRGKLQ